MTALHVDTSNVPPLPDEFRELGAILDHEMPDVGWTDVLRCCWVLSFGQAYRSGMDVIAGCIIRDWLVEDVEGPITTEASGTRFRLSDEGRAVARTVPR